MREGPELIEMPPERVSSLDEFTDEARTMYESDGEGYRLKDTARAAIEETNAEIAKVWQEGQAKLAEQDAKIAKLKRAYAEVVKLDAIQSALFAAGVNRKLLKVGTDFLLEHLRIELQDRDGDLVPTVPGFASVAAAVEVFLASDAGSFLSPAKPTQGHGPFAAAIKQLMH